MECFFCSILACPCFIALVHYVESSSTTLGALRSNGIPRWTFSIQYGGGSMSKACDFSNPYFAANRPQTRLVSCGESLKNLTRRCITFQTPRSIEDSSSHCHRKPTDSTQSPATGVPRRSRSQTTYCHLTP